MTSYLLGVDGGGTKTQALLANLEGDVLGRGTGGPSNYNAVSFEKACAAIETAISEASQEQPGKPAALCLGLAGAGRQEDIDRFHAWAQDKFPGAMVKVVSDAEILLAGIPSGPGMALVCGTGSIAYGRATTGELIRTGGWGYLFGDEGSGYAIGAAALRAVMQAHDGRGAPTLLTELILERRRIASPPDLVRSLYGAETPRSEIASLADLVERAAAQGDAPARAILEAAALELARSVGAVYRKLGAKPVPLALTGGVILHGVSLAGAFHRACNNLGLHFSAIEEVPEPAIGAILLARQMLEG